VPELILSVENMIERLIQDFDHDFNF
jgi:hypothetical protein